MSKTSDSKVIDFNQVKPEGKLERLNRLTGLDFEAYPESLLPENQQNRDEIKSRLVEEIKQLSNL